MRAHLTRSATLALFLLAAMRVSATDPGSSVHSAQLIEEAKALDGTTLVFEGEAIGDPLFRGDHAWLNISDGTYAIGIWVARPDLAMIERYGSYRWKGDRIRVCGTFHRVCPDHGGDLDIHALSLEVIERGTEVPRPIKPIEVLIAALLVAVGGLALVLWRGREKRSRAAAR
jgi:hypothetical protein